MNCETRLILEVGEATNSGEQHKRAVTKLRDITKLAEKDQLTDLYNALLSDDAVCWFRTYDQARVVLPDGEVLTGKPKNHSPLTIRGEAVAIEQANLPRWVIKNQQEQGVTHIGVPYQAAKNYQFLKPASGDRVVNAQGRQTWPKTVENQYDNMSSVPVQKGGLTL